MEQEMAPAGEAPPVVPPNRSIWTHWWMVLLYVAVLAVAAVSLLQLFGGEGPGQYLLTSSETYEEPGVATFAVPEGFVLDTERQSTMEGVGGFTPFVSSDWPETESRVLGVGWLEKSVARGRYEDSSGILDATMRGEMENPDIIVGDTMLIDFRGETLAVRTVTDPSGLGPAGLSLGYKAEACTMDFSFMLLDGSVDDAELLVEPMLQWLESFECEAA